MTMKTRDLTADDFYHFVGVIGLDRYLNLCMG